jgi:hypothetical protein
MSDPRVIADGILPQWAINAIIWVAVAVLSMFIGVLGWFTRKYILKVDGHADLLGAIPATYATIEMVNDMEETISGLVSRSELIAYMKELRDEQLRMHKDNLDASRDTRSDIRAVHDRVDALFKNGHAR